MARIHTLGKEERLKSRKIIQQLFADGRKIVLPPYRALYLFDRVGNPGLKVGIAVSAKNFRKAVDRNRVKRLTRESFRLQKSALQQLLMEKELSMHVFFIYTAKELPVYDDLFAKVGEIIKRLIAQVAK